MAFETIPHKVLANGENMPGRAAYFVRDNGEWVATSWKTYAEEVTTAAKALLALGLEPGTPVNILGFNRPEWVIMDLAAMAAGAVPAGIYTTNSPSECRYIVSHCGAPVILLEDEGQWDKIREVRADLPDLKHVVMMKDAPAIDDPMVMTWDEFMAKGADISDEVFRERLDSLQSDQLATLIYTSGTTGPPKGVMLSHENVSWTPQQVVAPFGLDASDRTLSYLPLSHIAEQSFSIHAPARVGYAVYYAESIEAVPENLKEVKPTIFFAVPRVWERFQAGITAQLEQATGAKAKIADWARGVGAKAVATRNTGANLPPVLAAQYKVAHALVFSKIHDALGLGEVKVAASGAAPISKETLEFFAGLDITVYEVYGQSEGNGPTTFNLPGRAKLGSVGPPYPNVEVKTAADGEILFKGKNVFLGYYKDPEATAETLIDGWLHSGDLGEFDSEGFLHITGRKKDIIITAGGKNVAPKPLESGLKNHRLVSEAVVIGDRRKFLSAVITLDEEQAAAFQAERGEDMPAHESESIAKEIQTAVDELNKDFARVEQIKKFAVLPRQLSIEGGELTPTLKVKRNKVSEHFAEIIDGMYEG